MNPRTPSGTMNNLVDPDCRSNAKSASVGRALCKTFTADEPATRQGLLARHIPQ